MTRTLRGNGSTSPVRVGIAGLGRSGWNIHSQTLRQLPEQYHVVAVTDAVAQRRAEAQQVFGCRAYEAIGEMLADDAVELVVVATPNHLHQSHAIAAMRCGKHVVCEKPFALRVDDADQAIVVSQETGRVLAPFQNRRYEPHFRQVQQILASGQLGRIVQVRMVWQSFGRRWDWQTLRRFGGGLLNNNGSHLLDQALQLYADDVEPELFVDLQRVLSLGDAEDHVKIVLSAPNQPTIDVELTSACAFPLDRWHIMASDGGLRGTIEQLEWRTVDWSTLPPRHVQTQPTPDREYNHETIAWRAHEWTRPADAPGEYECFYRDLFATLRHGRPLVITPQSVRRLIATLQRCYGLCDLAVCE